MHLGYHELRNMLQKFKEEREARKASGINMGGGAGLGVGGPGGPGGGPPPSSTASGIPPSGGAARDYRSSRDDYRDRDRDRGYDRERYSSRYECVLPFPFVFVSFEEWVTHTFYSLFLFL